MKRKEEAQANWEKLHSRRLQIGFGLLSCVFLFSSAAFLPSFHGSSLASWLLQFFAERLGSEQLHGVCLGGTFVVWLDATPKCPCDRSVIAKLIAQPVRIPRGQLKIFELLTKCERSVPFLERSLCHKHVTCALTWLISHLAVRVEIRVFDTEFLSDVRWNTLVWRIWLLLHSKTTLLTWLLLYTLLKTRTLMRQAQVYLADKVVPLGHRVSWGMGNARVCWGTDLFQKSIVTSRASKQVEGFPWCQELEDKTGLYVMQGDFWNVTWMLHLQKKTSANNLCEHPSP